MADRNDRDRCCGHCKRGEEIPEAAGGPTVGGVRSKIRTVLFVSMKIESFTPHTIEALTLLVKNQAYWDLVQRKVYSTDPYSHQNVDVFIKIGYMVFYLSSVSGLLI